ncbi:MAG: hypothetical protein H6Q76_1220, partial [Firmicutes bacterium]|nr:hypothetical protein [Bacillota bacterium]
MHLKIPQLNHFVFRKLSLVTISFALFLLFIVWMGLYYKIESEMKQEKEAAFKETMNFAKAFEEHTLRTIRGADQAVLFLKYQYEREGRSIDIPGYVREGRFANQPFVLMGVIDENGDFAVSNQVPFVPSNLKDREHFLVHKDRDSRQLFIGKPVMGRSSGKWALQMTRRINKPDGSFGGAVVVSVDPFYFTAFYKELDLGKNSSVTLLGLDGVVRARQSGQDNTVGQNVVDSGLMEHISAAPQGTYIEKSVVDGIKRIYSYRTMNDYPLAVLVGVDEEVYFATVTQRIKGYYIAVILISLSIVAFTLAMLFVIRRQYFAEAKLENMLDGLENQVSERTKELRHKNAELEVAYKELQNVQSQVIHQEKMASIGQLAAGVAHEINNPLGFTMSNFETLHKYTVRLVEVINEYRSFRSAAINTGDASLQKKAEDISAFEKKNKLEYILQDMDMIFQETQEGFKRVGDIVKALRIFSRVDQQGKAEDYDLTEGVRNSLIVSRNEVKYIATIKEELDDLPQVSAVGGQINQVLLNIILNAAYAIKDKELGEMGLITIRTYSDEKSVYCSIQDNGKGIPEHIKKDIFNPFFTTKPVGQGTGLGLSISYDIITN